ncbi:Cupin domain [Sporosarcina pasteurii]|uniref:Cupin domain n=1 Tax=Sporosarcina pasteurii TaxID=1474 RepID=A0A380CDX7_SPOPA|nr:Cupin domain [Sporosarcina pasteurii]
MRAIYYYPYGVQYQNPYYVNAHAHAHAHAQMYNYGGQYGYWNTPGHVGQIDFNDNDDDYDETIPLRDYGPRPFVVDIDEATKQNNTFRTALWTGPHLQLTLMSLRVGEDIGLEIHPEFDQFLRVEQGNGIVRMGSSQNNLDFVRNIEEDSAIIIPAGTWHNLTNTGNRPLKLYSIYAPPAHPRGTVHATKNDAMEAEAGYGQNN